MLDLPADEPGWAERLNPNRAGRDGAGGGGNQGRRTRGHRRRKGEPTSTPGPPAPPSWPDAVASRAKRPRSRFCFRADGPAKA